MRYRFHLALLGALGFVVWWTYAHREPAALPHTADAPPVAGSPQAQAAQAAKAQQEEKEAREAQAYIRELQRIEADRGLIDAAASRSQQARGVLQAKREEVWSTFIQTNWPAYQALRQAAIDSVAHSAQCTLCDHGGLMNFCLLCSGDGQCPACQGTGKSSGHQLCAVCSGKGTCYICFGKGRMPCPFCDDGLIYTSLPLPSQTLPLLGTALSRPGAQKDLARRSLPSPDTNIASAAPVAAAPTPAADAKADDSLLTRHQQIQLAVAALLVGIIILTRMMPWIASFFNQRSNTRAPASRVPAVAPNVLAEEQAFSAFVACLQAGPPQSTSSASRSTSDETAASPELSPPRFLAAPELLVSLRILLSEISRTDSTQQRHKILAHAFQQIAALENLSRTPELFPMWQLTLALEGLVQQLTHRSSNVTPSTLRTVAGAVDLLESLASPGLRPDLATNPPVRVLAVEKSLAGRTTAAAALKRVFGDADLAADEPSALELATKQPCDLIFVDAAMRGMDAFELCSKIRGAQATPVVLAVLGTDFESRAKSSLIEGLDLVAKPFLSFEIAVKALTLILRTRLQQPVQDFSPVEPLSPVAC